MAVKFKPMLSGKAPDDLRDLRYPVLVSPKLDGIRCLIRNGVAVSRNLKPIPNAYVQSRLKGLPGGLDGELIVGDPAAPDVWNKTQSGVMSEDGEPDFTFYVFDFCDDENGPDSVCDRATYFGDRLHYVKDAAVGWEKRGYPVHIVKHVLCHSPGDVDSEEHLWVGLGYEGIMLRDPHGAYKFGRSTVREGGLLKLKRWHDMEAVVVGMVERMHNANEATRDELGRTKRSSAKANKRGRGDMGALVCTLDRDPKAPIVNTFEVGTGFTDEDRAAFWKLGPKANGKLVKVKYQHLTPDGIPRFPVYMGVRDPRDMPAA